MIRGAAVIFNFINFHKKNLLPRKASVNDVSKLKKLFYLMNMEVRLLNDKKLSEFMDEVEKLAVADFSEYEGIYLVFMSHGTSNNVVYCKDGEFNLTDICHRIFTNESLTTKIKCAVVQSCKGFFDIDNKYLAQGSTATQANALIGMEDVVILFSSFEGFISYLGEDGAYFIDVFFKIMGEHFFSKTLLECLNMVVLEFNTQRDNQAVKIHTQCLKELKYYRIGKKQGDGN